MNKQRKTSLLLTFVALLFFGSGSGSHAQELTPANVNTYDNQNTFYNGKVELFCGQGGNGLFRGIDTAGGVGKIITAYTVYYLFGGGVGSAGGGVDSAGGGGKLIDGEGVASSGGGRILQNGGIGSSGNKLFGQGKGG